MGYYSDVRIVMSQEGWKVFKGYVDENCRDEDEVCEVYNLAEHLDVWYTRDNWVYFGWNSIKFYDDFEEVAAIYQGLDCLKESDYSYNFAELGEAYDDFNTLQYSSKTRKEERWLPEPYEEKYFDDLYLIKGVEMQADILANRYLDADPRIPEVLEKAAQKIREKREEEKKRREELRKINEQRKKIMVKEYYANSDCASVKVGIEPAFSILIPVSEDGTTEIIVCEKDEVKTDIRHYFSDIGGEKIGIYSYDVFGQGKVLATISGKYHVYANKQTVVLERYGAC